MRIREFESLIAGVISGWSKSDIDQRTRRLREMKMLPTGGRGLNAPAIEAKHAANILIALAAAEKAVETHIAIITYAPMVPKSATPGKFDFLGCESFADALTKILDTPAVADRIKEISVCRSWPEATIFFDESSDGKSKQERYAPADQPDNGYGYGVRNDIIISGGVLAQLANDLQSPSEDGKWEDG